MEQDNEKALKQLVYSYDMYENTKKETEKKMKDAINVDGTRKYSKEDIKRQLDLLEESQKDVIKQYVALGGNEEDLTKKRRKKMYKSETNPVDFNDVMNKVNEEIKENKQQIEETKNISDVNDKFEGMPSKGNYNSDAIFDVIPLPSNGEPYKNKTSKVSVAYLTAYDENMIVSPNLYRDNLILDYILQEKLLSQEVEPIDLLEGDREAIILFLRASGYGNEYPITATDDETGKEFDTVIDLSKLKYKEFNLKGDTNGWFEFKLPVSEKVVKFRFPTHRDNLILERMEKAEEPKLQKETIKNYAEVLNTFIEEDKTMDGDNKAKIRKAIRTIENWSENMDEENALKYNHKLTNKLNLLVMSVDGITNKEYIKDFIRKMNVRDSAALRKYMTNNEPGIDYHITIERPESLGGGSFTTFLQFDQFLFLNIAG